MSTGSKKSGSKKSRHKRPLNTPGIPTNPQETNKEKLLRQVGNLPPKAQQEFLAEVTSSATHQSSFSGPIPSPSDFSEYAKVLPNAPERIMAMAEKEQDIRQQGLQGRIKNDKKIISNDRSTIYAATVLGAMLIIVAGLALWKGYWGAAIAFGLFGAIVNLLRRILDWFNRNKSDK